MEKLLKSSKREPWELEETVRKLSLEVSVLEAEKKASRDEMLMNERKNRLFRQDLDRVLRQIIKEIEDETLPF